MVTFSSLSEQFAQVQRDESLCRSLRVSRLSCMADGVRMELFGPPALKTSHG